MPRTSCMQIVFFVTIFCFLLQTTPHCAVATENETMLLLEDNKKMIIYGKLIFRAADNLINKIKNDNKDNSLITKEQIFSINAMLMLVSIKSTISYCRSVYDMARVNVTISLYKSTDYKQSKSMSSAKEMIISAENLLTQVIQDSRSFSHTHYESDFKTILMHLNEIKKYFPPPSLGKCYTTQQQTHQNLSLPYHTLGRQTDSLSSMTSLISTTIAKTSVSQRLALGDISDALVSSWDFQISFIKIHESFEWAAICHLTHTHPSIAGFDKSEANALQNLAICVQSLTNLKELIRAQASDNTPWFKSSDAERYTRAFDAWRKALVEALASDGLALPEVAGKQAGPATESQTGSAK